MGKLEELLEIGGTKKDITLLVISGSAIVLSLLGISPFPFDMSWIAIVLCGLLEELTVARARAGIEKLVHLTPQTARVIKDGKESVIPSGTSWGRGSGRRNHYFRTDFRQPGGYDRGVPSS